MAFQNTSFNAPVMSGKASDFPAMGINPSAVPTPAVAREIASIQAQTMMAKAYPRNEVASLKKIEQACGRETLANNAIYQYARGGSDIKGPSIRLAEALAACWGNIKYGIEEVSNENGESKVRAFAFDLETNTQSERVFTVKHVRDTNNGSYKLKDQRDIYEKVANDGARRLRACILEIIPGDVTDYAVELCNQTRLKTANVTPEKIEGMKSAYAEYGVNLAMLEAFIQRTLTAMSSVQYLKLRDIYASLRDGIAKVEDFFDINLSDAAKAAEKAKAEMQEKTSPAPAQPVAEEPGPETFVDDSADFDPFA